MEKIIFTIYLYYKIILCNIASMSNTKKSFKVRSSFTLDSDALENIREQAEALGLSASYVVNRAFKPKATNVKKVQVHR